MKIFISYASEDREFVRGVVAVLERDFTVWWDQNSLHVGDSLLEKISDGLNTCDFGVVVLSRHFFEKKWPRAELDGLFSLQTVKRKVILPVWYGVGEAEVGAFSRILAGKLGARTDQGPEHTAEQLKQAIDAATIQASFDPISSANARFLALDRKAAHHSAAAKLCNTSQGVQLVDAEVQTIFRAIEEQVAALQPTSSLMKLACKVNRRDSLAVSGPYRLNVHLDWSPGGVTNSITRSKLQLLLFRSEIDDWGMRKEPRFFKKDAFYPFFDENSRVIWTKSPEEAFQSAQIVETVIQSMTDQIEAREENRVSAA